MKRGWPYYLIIALVTEKIVQHVFVTLAFIFNWGDIASTVAVSPAVLMIAGAIVAFLFVLTLWSLLKQQGWALNLLVFLALFDIVGEFVAQGRIDIVINVSFLVATLLLVLALIYRRTFFKERS